MERLTKDDYIDTMEEHKKLTILEDVLEKHDIDVNQLDNILTECAEHKKIEKEFGTGLGTLFKVLKKGVYCREEDFICWYQGRDDIRIHIKGFYNSKLCIDYHWEDQGKTWAFTREELE